MIKMNDKRFLEICQDLQNKVKQDTVKGIFFVFKLNSYGQMIHGVRVTEDKIAEDLELGQNERESIGVLMTASYEACLQVGQFVLPQSKKAPTFHLSFGSARSGFYLGRHEHLKERPEHIVGMVYQDVDNPAKYKFLIDKYYFNFEREEQGPAFPVAISSRESREETSTENSLFNDIHDDEIDAIFNPYFEV
jgi:hypothetical protein